MSTEKQEEFNSFRAQGIVFYPFKYKKDNALKGNKEIRIDPVSTDQSNNIIYGDFIKYYDTQYNVDDNNNYSEIDKEYSRSLYSVSLDDKNKFTDESIHKPQFIEENNTKNSFKEFVNLFQAKISKKREDTFKENEVDSAIIELVKKFPAYLSHANLVLYNKTQIGFLELYIDYEYNEPINDNETLINLSKIISNDIGNLKKLFFSRDNQYSIKDRENKAKTIYDDTDLEILTTFINQLNIKENISITKDDVMFYNRNFKRRAYAQTNVYMNEKCYDMLLTEKDNKQVDLNEFMMYIGRTHDFDGRKLKDVSFEQFIIRNENDNVFGVTNSSFGILSKCASKENYNYSMQHLSEQFMFFCEMSLHLRYYLYIMTEIYRNNTGNYHEIKVEFTKNITRYKLSLISEVEPQRVYEKLLEELRIEKLYEDANKALDSLQAAEEKRNDQIVTVLSVFFALFGIFGIANNLNDWLGTILNGNYMGITNFVTFISPFVMLGVAVLLLLNKKNN